jgi:putative ABC transport system permease protein
MGQRFYRIMLRLLPQSIRDRYGPEMEALLAEHLVEAKRRGGGRLLLIWLGATRDVLSRSVYERRRRWKRARKGRRVSMFATDVKTALRGFVREPGMTVLMVLMLTLGIAANIVVFSLVDGLFLRPLPFRESDRLVYLNETAPRWNLEYTGINYPDFHGWRENARLFEGLALYDGQSFNLSDGQNAARVEGLAVTYDFTAVLGIRPELGRAFTEEEDRPGAGRVAMLGWHFWQTRFGGAPDVIGRTLRLDGEPVTIVGVLPRTAVFPNPADVWVPLAGDPAQAWQSYSFEGIGRIKRGVSLDQARADLDRAHEPVWAAADTSHIVSPRLEDLREHFVGDYRPMALALAGGVALVLLIACANVASVLLARASARRKEIGIRTALGAGSWRVARQLLTESLLLSLGAGGVGLLLGYWGSRALIASVPDQLPAWAVFTLSWRVIFFSFLASTIVAVLFGWAPVVQARRSSLASVLSAGTTRSTISPGGRRTLNGLVVAEIALALVLLVSGGLLFVAFQQLRAVDPGFRTDNVVSLRISLPPSMDDGSPEGIGRGLVFFDALLERVRALPGVDAAAATSCPPLSCHQGQFVEPEGGTPPAPGQPDPVILTQIATPGYFEALDIRLTTGRSFVESDGTADSAGVVIINEMLAEQLWPGVTDPVGRRLRFRGSDGPWLTVIGVAENVKHYGLDEPSRPSLFVPLRQRFRGSLAVLAHASVNPASLIAPIRSIVRELNPDLPVFQVGSMASALAQSMALRRTYSRFLAIFAIVALALAAGGLYGVVSYGVNQRTKELGIRVALGARREQLVGMVLRQGMWLLVAGLAIGTLAAIGAVRLLSSLLFGVRDGDPLVFATAAAVLAGTAIVANLVPAWRASRLDPQAALREEST